MTYDPLVQLKKLAQDDTEIQATIAPRGDGIFPKKVVIRLRSTEEVVFETELNKGERFTFVPPMSGQYILSIFPKEE